MAFGRKVPSGSKLIRSAARLQDFQYVIMSPPLWRREAVTYASSVVSNSPAAIPSQKPPEYHSCTNVRYQSEGKTLGKVFRTLRPNFLILLLPREDQLLPSYKEWLRSLSRWPPTKFRASLPPVFVQLPLACSLPVSFPESHLVMKDARHGKYDQNSKWRSTGSYSNCADEIGDAKGQFHINSDGHIGNNRHWTRKRKCSHSEGFSKEDPVVKHTKTQPSLSYSERSKWAQLSFTNVKKSNLNSRKKNHQRKCHLHLPNRYNQY